MFETVSGVQTELMPKNSALKLDARLRTYFYGEDHRHIVTSAMFDQAAGDYDQAKQLTALKHSGLEAMSRIAAPMVGGMIPWPPCLSP